MADHAEAVEYDLLRVGLRLRDVGTGRCQWGDVRAVVYHAGPDSALARSVRGHHWTAAEELLALAVDLLARGNWQRGGKKSAPKPKPVPRPWGQDSQIVGSDPLPVEEFATWWASH